MILCTLWGNFCKYIKNMIQYMIFTYECTIQLCNKFMNISFEKVLNVFHLINYIIGNNFEKILRLEVMLSCKQSSHLLYLYKR